MACCRGDRQTGTGATQTHRQLQQQEGEQPGCSPRAACPHASLRGLPPRDKETLISACVGSGGVVGGEEGNAMGFFLSLLKTDNC